MAGRAPHTLTPRPSWRDRAACRDEDPDLYFDERYLPKNLSCARCPVADECLAAAMRAEGTTAASMRYGIFGGLTSKQRAALAKGKPVSTATPAAAGPMVALGLRGPQPTEPCGTRAAYRRHQRHGQTPCAACKAAESRHRSKYNQPRRMVA